MRVVTRSARLRRVLFMLRAALTARGHATSAPRREDDQVIVEHRGGRHLAVAVCRDGSLECRVGRLAFGASLDQLGSVVDVLFGDATPAELGLEVLL